MAKGAGTSPVPLPDDSSFVELIRLMGEVLQRGMGTCDVQEVQRARLDLLLQQTAAGEHNCSHASGKAKHADAIHLVLNNAPNVHPYMNEAGTHVAVSAHAPFLVGSPATLYSVIGMLGQGAPGEGSGHPGTGWMPARRGC